MPVPLLLTQVHQRPVTVLTAPVPAGGPGPRSPPGRARGTIPQYEYVGGPAEAELRREISRYCAEADRVHFGGEPGRANRAVFCAFGFKSRTQMGLAELEEVLGWVQDEWPLA